VLAVVQHEEDGLRLQGALQGLDQRLPAALAHAGRQGDGGRDVLRLGERRQRHEPRALREVAGRGGGGLKGQARLAHAAGAGQGHQAHVRPPQPRPHGCHLLRPPDEAGRRPGQTRVRTARARPPVGQLNDDRPQGAGVLAVVLTLPDAQPGHHLRGLQGLDVAQLQQPVAPPRPDGRRPGLPLRPEAGDGVHKLLAQGVTARAPGGAGLRAEDAGEGVPP
jgi:hypothetical protein